jgi:hypothetical protein
MPFSSCHYKKTSLDLVFHNIYVRFAPNLYATGEEVQTYPTGVSPVASGVTYDTAYVISTMYTPGLLFGALCVSHIKMLSNAFDSNVIEVLKYVSLTLHFVLTHRFSFLCGSCLPLCVLT